jgi:hypothetical protein
MGSPVLNTTVFSRVLYRLSYLAAGAECSRPSSKSTALCARTAQDDVVPFDLVAGLGPDSIEGALEASVGERLDLSAVVADQVVVMLSAGQHRLVPSGVGEVEPLNESQADKLVERAVDARDSDPPTFRAEQIDDLVRSQAALLLGEKRHHKLSRPAGSTTGDCELRARMRFPPGGVLCVH